MPGFTPAGERVVFEGGLVRVAVGTFQGPDGSSFEREIVHHPGAVAVVPVLDDGRTVVLVRQYRAAIDADLLEIPAGKLDVSGEGPDDAAARELEEEIGMRPGRVERLAELYTSPGFCDERAHLYLATGLRPVPLRAQGIEEQHMTVERVSLDDVPAMVADGRLRDAKTVVGLQLAERRLRRS